jgi:hypothetical protein
VTPRWELFADILKVGVPGLINIAITNLSVVVLTGIAGQLGRDTALGYAMGGRLEYILQPIAFGFGTVIVAMVGTNWGAQQHRRAPLKATNFCRTLPRWGLLASRYDRGKKLGWSDEFWRSTPVRAVRGTTGASEDEAVRGHIARVRTRTP